MHKNEQIVARTQPSAKRTRIIFIYFLAQSRKNTKIGKIWKSVISSLPIKQVLHFYYEKFLNMGRREAIVIETNNIFMSIVFVE